MFGNASKDDIKDLERGTAYLRANREIWRRTPADYYSPSIHVTANGSIGINVGGRVHVLPVEKWHNAYDRGFVDGARAARDHSDASIGLSLLAFSVQHGSHLLQHFGDLRPAPAV